MSSLRHRSIAAAAVLAVLAVTATTAAPALASTSSDPVVTAINGQDAALKASGKIQALVKKKISTPAQAKRAESEVTAVIAKLNHAATVVAKAKAPTSQDRRGQKDWVGGIHGLVKGFGQFDVALKDLAAGNQARAKAELVTFEKTVIKAAKLGKKGDKLLGIG